MKKWYNINNCGDYYDSKKLLQLADCCCRSLYQSLTYNNERHFDYIDRIKTKIYSKNKKMLSYGLKLVPNGSNSIELNNLIKYLTNRKK